MTKYYVADFETMQEPDLSETWVWAACLMEMNTLSYQVWNNIDGFIEKLGTLGDKKDKIIIYFHNLKFDGSFIMYNILTEREMTRNETAGRNCRVKLKKDEYLEMIDGMGKWYRLRFNINGRQIEIRDSLKILPFSVQDIAKSLKLPEEKGEIDYTMYRPRGWEITEEEEDYIRRDCEIVARAVRDMFINNGYDKLTIGANCMKEYKELNKHFDQMFPKLDDKEDEFVREGYRGGLCWCRENIKITDDIRVIDMNSMYPSVMIKYQFPCGQGTYFKGEPQDDNYRPLWVCRVKALLELKPNCIPCLQEETFKNCQNFIENGYIDTVVTKADWELITQMYNTYDVEWIDGYKYRVAYKPFNKYINKWYKIKEQATVDKDPVKRLLAKLFLNNLGGKFGTNPKGRMGVIDVNDRGLLGLITEEIDKGSVYVPVAAFMTAYARQELIKAAMLCGGYEKVLYMDTDSVHFVGTELPDGLEVSDTEIGKWALEGEATKGIYIRQKTYAEYIEDKWDVKACGCPQKAKKNIKNVETDFKVGMKVKGKLVPKKVPGGVVLVDRGFQIK